VSEASALTRARTAGTLSREANAVIDRFWRQVDREAQAAMRPLLQPLVEHPETPREVRELLRAASFPTGQWQAMLASSAAGTAVSVGLSDLLSNYLGPSIQAAIRVAPTGLISVGDAAQGVARGLISTGLGRDIGARQGLGANQFDRLVRLARRPVDPGAVIELVRRKRLGRQLAGEYLQEAGLTDQAIGDLLNLAETILSPEQLAEMWNRSIVDTREGREIAARSGMSAGDFDKLTELGGMPLAPQELGEAFRRGFIDQVRFRRGIVQGPLRNEWFDVLERLQLRRMSTVDAADAVNQNFMSETEGRSVARANGLDPDDFSVLLETAGLPPGVSFAQEALNRGKITRAEFRQAFLESRTKNKYVDLFEEMRIRLVPQETMRLMYREGVATRAQTLENLQQQGFSAKDSASLVDLEDRRRITETRQLTRAQIETLYREQILSRADAGSMLEQLGYDRFGIEAILGLADLARVQKFINALVTKIRSAYVKRHIDEVTASGLLDAAGMPVDGRDSLFALWDLERTTIVRDLTPAQITTAWSKGLLTRPVARARLEGVGYSTEDAEILLQLRDSGTTEPVEEG
jgi:hypothetical protein